MFWHGDYAEQSDKVHLSGLKGLPNKTSLKHNIDWRVVIKTE